MTEKGGIARREEKQRRMRERQNGPETQNRRECSEFRGRRNQRQPEQRMKRGRRER